MNIGAPTFGPPAHIASPVPDLHHDVTGMLGMPYHSSNSQLTRTPYSSSIETSDSSAYSRPVSINGTSPNTVHSLERDTLDI